MKNYEGHNDNYISPEDIINKYVPLGFSHFKISGRGDLARMIEEVVRYLIKEEYQEDVRIRVWNTYLQHMELYESTRHKQLHLPLKILNSNSKN